MGRLGREGNQRCYGSAATEFFLRDGGSFLSTLNVVSGQFFVFAKAHLFALDPALAAGLLFFFFFNFLLFCLVFSLLFILGFYFCLRYVLYFVLVPSYLFLQVRLN